MIDKITIANDTLEKSVESVSFNVNAPASELGSPRMYRWDSMIITGKIGFDEDINVLSNWASISAMNHECHKEIIVEESKADQLVRKIRLSKAFVISYSESYTDDTGIGHYSVFIRNMIEQGTEITNEGNTKTIGELDNKNVIEAAEEVVFLAQTAVNIEKAVSKKKGLSFTDMLEKQEKMLDNEGAADVAQIGHDFGKAGVLAENPGIKVEWEIQTKHGAQRMAERGVTQEMVDSWVKNGKALKQAGGRKYLFFTKEGAAVVGKDGYLVTVIPESDYDDAYKALSKSLFGK